VVTIARSATLADAAATAVCNLVQKPADINTAIETGRNISGLKGIVIIIGGDIAVWGSIKLCETAL
jgi:hypothetical protein